MPLIAPALLLAAAFCGPGPAAAQLIDDTFTYQGRLKLDGQPVNGPTDLTFYLFDAAVGGNVLGSPVTLPATAVSEGLFTVELNFDAPDFTGEARWLQVAARHPAGGAGGYTDLTPRQPLRSAPYAWHAVEAENGGELTIDNGEPGVMWTRSPNGTDVFIGGTTSAGIGLSGPASRLHVRAPFNAADTARFDDNLSTSQLRIATPQSAGRAELQAWNLQTNVAGPLAFNVAGGNVGIGTNAPGSRLDVAGSFEADAFRLNGSGAAAGRVLTSDASGNGTWQAGPSGSQWTTNGTHIGYPGAGNVGIGTTSPNLTFDVRNNGMIGTSATSVSQHDVSNRGTKTSFGYQPVGTTEFVGMRSVIAAGTSTCGNTADIRFDTWECGTAFSREVMRINGGGEVGIGTATPASKLDVVGTITSDGLDVAGNGTISGNVGIGTAAPTAKLHVSSPNYASAIIESNNTSGTWLNLGNSSAGAGYWQLIASGSGNGGGARQLLIGTGPSADSSSGTAITVANNHNVGIGTLTPAVKLHVAGNSEINPGSGGNIVSGFTNGLNIGMDDNEIMARNNGVASTLYINNDGGDVVLAPNGTTKVRVLEIVGADVAERFPSNDEIAPGMVVAIDVANPGKLCLARGRYNKQVAGIASGANGLPAGTILGNLPGHEDAAPIALSGRVWCWCDADQAGAIEAGDMLTTSDTLGHAMKCADRDRAYGAVIGKAMTSLKSGKGLVLVLVSLQ